jgi:histidine triad (HIT) family protein
VYYHAPADYVCPFCLIAQGLGTDWSSDEDVVYRNSAVTAFVAAAWWPNNPGHIIVIPNEHFENIYDLPIEFATEIHRVARDIALAFKATYKCDGVSTRQHNEPAGNQDVWHYHLHVFPRYDGDDLYLNLYHRRYTTAEERLPYAAKLRKFLNHQADAIKEGTTWTLCQNL